MSTELPPAGWYGDPAGPGSLRYWDGGAWTEHRAPVPAGQGPTTARGTPTGKQLLRVSLALFRQNRQMIWLPVLSGVMAALAFLVVSGVVAVPLIRAYGASELTILYLFPGLVASTFVTVYCNVALVFAANEQIEGRPIEVRGALRMAWTRKRTIVSWALLSATVGLVIQSIESRLGIFGRLAGLLGGLAWAVANFMVVPVLAFEDVGPIEAVKRSSHVFRTTFGTITRGALRFGVLFLGWMLAALAALVVGIGVAASGAVVPGVILAAAGVVGLFVVSMYFAAASMYMRTILYRYATHQPVPDLGLDLSRTFQK
jgi:hypothetical protein